MSWFLLCNFEIIIGAPTSLKTTQQSKLTLTQLLTHFGKKGISRFIEERGESLGMVARNSHVSTMQRTEQLKRKYVSSFFLSHIQPLFAKMQDLRPYKCLARFKQ